jgi:hypothetical protein
LSSIPLSKHLKVKILPVVLYGCETSPPTLREEHELRVFENRVQRIIHELKNDEIIGGWRIFHNEKLHNLCSSLNVISNDKIKGDEMDRACITHGKDEKCMQSYGRKAPEGKKTLGRPRRRREDTIKMEFREMGWGADWVHLVQDRNLSQLSLRLQDSQF